MLSVVSLCGLIACCCSLLHNYISEHLIIILRFLDYEKPLCSLGTAACDIVSCTTLQQLCHLLASSICVHVGNEKSRVGVQCAKTNTDSDRSSICARSALIVIESRHIMYLVQVRPVLSTCPW